MLSHRWKRVFAYVGVFGLLLGLAAFGMPRDDGDEVHISMDRIVGAPLPPPTPEPTPEPPRGPPECEELNNPGGGIRWVPSPDAGPWPTDGTVALPALGVDAPIVRVGVGTNGEMVVPSNAHEVAWLDQGEFPGQTQNAVLAGHVNWARQPGAFVRLEDLREGDPVVVHKEGKRWEFEVVWVCAFDRNTPHAEQIMGYTEAPSVTLVTCGGVFDRGAGTHTHRIIARAELVSVTETA